jgi:triacylglycerol esterase/lipase EstA (alpha/beta hydrolase family)
MPDNNEISFVISGQAQGGDRGGGLVPAARPAGSVQGTVKSSVRLSSERGGGETVRVTATPGEDVVVLHISGGPSLVLNPETARDLLLGQGTAQRSAGVPGDVPVPAQLRWRGLEQAAPTRGGGFLGDVLLSAFDVITGLVKDDAADFAAAAVVKKVDGQVDPGVYPMNRETLTPLKGNGQKLAQVPAAPNGGPLLVLVHGTFVETVSTFGKLWAQHPQSVAQLFDFYGDRVYALDHPTIGQSPFANALTLVATLPQGARLHLVTHSRGGLVAEVLARLAAQRTVGDADLAFFAGDAYAPQRAELQALAAAISARDIHVDRVVRVACPARGTLLASKRLDAYLSVLKWSLELAGLVVVPELVDFLTEVARRRADPALLPGLAAMIPDTPLVNWLNAAPQPIAGQLRVVAGDLQGDAIGSWLKTLLADAYYWTDNDIVVQTRSMYGGAPRQGGAAFLLDQGGKVTHFNYFVNQRTVDAVVGGLTQDQPQGFRTIGPLSWAGQDSGGLRGAAAPDDGQPASAKPAVFVLPGILGSNLAANGQRIWLSLHLVGGLDKLAYTGQPDGVLPDGPIGLTYNDLIDHLSASHEVIPFAFDWRKPIEQEAQRLADAVDAALAARNTSGQPVRLLAHSMGGLLARTVQLERPATWQRLMARDGGRLLMLGTPNGGSWAPMQVLSGDDTFGNALAAFGSPLRDHAARQMMAAMPGFLQLQAGLLDPAQGLDRSDKWAQLAADDLKKVQEVNWWHRYAGENQEAAYQWGVPPQNVLDQAKALRVRLDHQRDNDLAGFADKLLLVVGHAKFTPDGYEVGEGGLVYLDATDGGDGRVPLDLALLPGVRTWTLDAEHGSLPEAQSAFSAFDDLLMKGDTDRLDRYVPAAASRGAASAVVHVRSRPARGRLSGAPADSQRAVFDIGDPGHTEAPDGGAGSALRVSVLNGNLAFINQPLLVGHYRSLALTGTESVLNRLVSGAMKASLDAGLYPGPPGTHQIFVNRGRDPDNPWRAPRPHSVIVVGLGDEGKLHELELSQSVRQAVIAWAQRVAENAPAPTSFEIAATLMGSGGVGIHTGSAARAIALGVRDANERLAAGGWPVVGGLTLVELYLERAADAWHGLQVLATANPGRFDVAPTVSFGTGPLRRQVDSGYRGTDYDFVRAATQGEGTITFALDSKRARTEVRAQVTQARLVRELVSRASTSTNQDPQIGRTLFQLLVPLEVEPFLGGTNRMLLELDDGTAPIPWELLDTPDDRSHGGDQRPWAIRSSLLRKLRTDDYREQVQDANREDNVLVIGEPMADPARYPRLPGALAEGKAVARQLGAIGGIPPQRLTALLDHDDASTVINALYARRYRIVHIAGHGEPRTEDQPGQPGTEGGVVMSGGTFLGPHEIGNMRTVPELVFVNCCHLAAREPGQTLRDFDRSGFAAGVADQLIRIGVRCVIAAGWAVDDGPASLFATTFYRQLLAGAPFIAAVASAREAAWQQGGNTWAAYQCYGDPDWRFNPDDASPEAGISITEEYASVASPLGLALALEELAVQSRYQGAKPRDQLARVRHLEARFAGLWGGMGAVAEAFALAHADAGARDLAIPWYERALQAGDASASMKASEQLGNLRARRAWERVKDAEPGSPLFTDSRALIGQALASLEALAALQPTVERHSLCGSACKRLALLERRAGDAPAEAAALAKAAQAYGRAEALAATAQPAELFYPGLNRMATELLHALADPAWPGFAADASAAVRQSLQAKTHDDPDFFSMVGLVEVELYTALAQRRLAPQLPGFANAYADLRTRVSSPGQWASVADQAEFVMVPYAAAAGGQEANAARALLAALKGYAAG